VHHFNSNHCYVDVNDQKLIKSFAQVLICKVVRQTVHSVSSNSLTADVLRLSIIERYDLFVH